MTRDDVVANDLIKEIRFFSNLDDEEQIDTVFIDKFKDVKYHNKWLLRIEFSALNRRYLNEYYKKVANSAKAVLEIGVCRNGPNSSTWCILNNKKPETYYFGVDLIDRTFLDDKSKNIYTIQNNSSNIDEIMKYVRSKGVDQFDFIFIDGWHSINQVLDDWKYTEFLAEGGIVGFHDTNVHAGPVAFLAGLDETKYQIDRYCTNFFDNGISFVTKK